MIASPQVASLVGEERTRHRREWRNEHKKCDPGTGGEGDSNSETDTKSATTHKWEALTKKFKSQRLSWKKGHG